MHTLLIAYDADGDRATSLVDAIRHYPCARLSESAYAINTKRTATEVFDHLSDVASDDGSLYVIPLDAPAVGHGPHYVHNLLRSWLGEEGSVPRKPRQSSVDGDEPAGGAPTLHKDGSG